MNAEKMNIDILNEANKILYDMNLLEVLNEFGETFITGSYFLNLMTWRDLDIYIKNDSMDKEKFCKLGGMIASILSPHKMNYRDETLLKRGKPNGLYWGIYADIFKTGTWKLDVFVLGDTDFDSLTDESKQLKKKIDEKKRKAILEIKYNICSNPLYGKEIFSVDIYNSVIDDNVSSIDEFNKWVMKKKEH